MPIQDDDPHHHKERTEEASHKAHGIPLEQPMPQAGARQEVHRGPRTCSIDRRSGGRRPKIPTDVVLAICRGVARQQQEDAALGASTGRMIADEVRSFAHNICNLNEGRKIGIRRIDSIHETENGTTPVGTFPEHWVDNWHELEGGNDLYGVRPRYGFTIFQAEMNGLSFERTT